MCTVKSNLKTVFFPLTLKQNKILKKIQQILTPWQAWNICGIIFTISEKVSLFCRSERVKKKFLATALKKRNYPECHNNKFVLFSRKKFTLATTIGGGGIAPMMILVLVCMSTLSILPWSVCLLSWHILLSGRRAIRRSTGRSTQLLITEHKKAGLLMEMRWLTGSSPDFCSRGPAIES